MKDCSAIFGNFQIYLFVATNSNAFENVYVVVLILTSAFSYSFITECIQGICPHFIQRPSLFIYNRLHTGNLSSLHTKTNIVN